VFFFVFKDAGLQDGTNLDSAWDWDWDWDWNWDWNLINKKMNGIFCRHGLSAPLGRY
jgi:hypothetical protein